MLIRASPNRFQLIFIRQENEKLQCRHIVAPFISDSQMSVLGPKQTDIHHTMQMIIVMKLIYIWNAAEGLLKMENNGYVRIK